MEHFKKNIYGYLIVDEYFESFIEINILLTAFHLRIIDYLIKKKKSTIQNISKDLQIKEKGLKTLFDILLSYKILELQNNHFKFTDKFESALKYRDLLEWKLWFTKLVGYNTFKNFSKIIKNNYSLEKSKIIEFWDYTNKKEYSKEQFFKIKKWIRFMSVLTKYDSLSCIYNCDFGAHKNILDIGGNSGEFALQICKNYKNVNISVFDLPIVCDIGKEYLKIFPEKNRIKFIKGDIRFDDIPYDFDMIMFKSMLHDWPKDKVILFLKKAYDSLEKDGKILIFEFEKLNLLSNKLIDKYIMWLPFLNYFRKPKEYFNILKKIGFKNLKIKKIKETNYFLITGEK